MESGTFCTRVPTGRLLSSLGGSVGSPDSGVDVVGAEFSLSSSSSTTIWLAAVDPCIWKSSKMDGGIEVSIPGRQTLSKFTAGSSQQNSMHSRSESCYPLVSVSCAPTLESNSSLVSKVPCWLGVLGTRGKWLSRNFCLWDSNKDQAASGIARELTVKFSSRSFTDKTTESGQKFKIHCVPLLETVNCLALIVKERVSSWRKVWKTKKK